MDHLEWKKGSSSKQQAAVPANYSTKRRFLYSRGFFDLLIPVRLENHASRNAGMGIDRLSSSSALFSLSPFGPAPVFFFFTTDGRRGGKEFSFASEKCGEKEGGVGAQVMMRRTH